MRPNTNAAHRLIRWAGADGGKVGEAIMRAHFPQGRDIGDHATLATPSPSNRAWIPTPSWRASTAGEDIMAVDQECVSASRAGITGVPFMIFGSRVAVSGAEAAGPHRHGHRQGQALALQAQDRARAR